MKADARLIAAAPDLLAACEAFRDAVLHGRDQLQEECLDSDQTNAVLGLFDDVFHAAITKATH